MISVVPAAPAAQSPALRLLFNRLSAEDRRAQIADLMDAVGRGRITLDGLLLAEEDGAVLGAVLYVLQEDRTAFVWPPGVRSAERADVTDLLLTAVIARIQDAGAWIGQCLIDRHDSAGAAALTRNGFSRLTELRFLVRMLDVGPEPTLSTVKTGDALEATVYQPGVNDARFARLVEETYEQTRDCPELQGRRTGEQSLASHRMSGQFDSSRWWLFRWRDQDAGVLFMNDHPAQNAWEVVYMGVSRDCRGHGLGRRMMEHGLSAARRANRSGVTLAVDQRNDYANRLYDELGFIETDAKVVHVYFPERPFGTPG